LEAVSFLRGLNEAVYAEFPDVQTIAEESTAWPMVSRPTSAGGLGFGLKWDMGWMNDTLQFLRREPVYRAWHLQEVTFRTVYAFAENFVLPLSHDEVVHGKRSLASQMPGDQWQQLAGLRLLLAAQYAAPGKKLQFMGAELGQWTEWNHDGELDWSLRKFPGHEGVRRL
ncbi:MAG: 1,4-alpha-glucan branching enzyme, partial [Planctomycetaceae bacterium]